MIRPGKFGALAAFIVATAWASEAPPPASTSPSADVDSPKTTGMAGETIVGVAMELKDWNPTAKYEVVVRMAFHPSPSGWAAFPNPVPYPFQAELADLPRQVEWAACRSGKAIGSVKTSLVPNRSYSKGGLHLPTSPADVPFSGDRANEFSGWMGEPVHRPVVAVAGGRCADPDEWREAPPGRATLKALRRAMRPVAKVLQCDEHAKWVPWAYRDDDIRMVSAYRSRFGDWLVALQVRDAPQASKECDGFGGPEVDPQLFHVTPSGSVRHLGASLRVLDFGDYDGDGRSEVIAMLQRYNRDGFVLFFDGLARSATFSWGYH